VKDNRRVESKFLRRSLQLSTHKDGVIGNEILPVPSFINRNVNFGLFAIDF
jgi:hypothetical protein